jgi:hypothetical protein
MRVQVEIVMPYKGIATSTRLYLVVAYTHPFHEHSDIPAKHATDVSRRLLVFHSSQSNSISFSYVQ